MKSAVVIFYLLLLSLTAKVQAQQEHNFHFLVEPKGLVINPYSTLYSYVDQGGWLLTCRTTTRPNRVSFPSSVQAIGYVTNSYFFNGAHGFITGEYGLFTTLDSGKTWRDRGRPPVNTSFEDIRYNPETAQLFTIAKGDGLWASSDRGKTWEKQVTGSFRGLAFNGLNGVVTADKDGHGLRTSDGGRTWIESLIPAVAGRPRYTAGEQKFLAASDLDNSIYETSDLGKTWTKKMFFLHSLLGDIFEDCNKYYVPSENGFYVFNNDEWIWQGVSFRRPIIYCITPFTFSYVIGNNSKPLITSIYRQNSLWFTNSEELRLTIPRCSTVTKTLSSFVATGISTADVTISLLNPSKNITITSMPDTAVSGNFEFTIEATDAGEGDSALIIIHAQSGCREQYSYIKVYIKHSGERALPATQNLAFPVTSTCNKEQKWIYIENPDCDSVTIEKAVLRSNVTAFTILNEGVFPRTLAGLARDSFQVEFAPTTIGSLTDFMDITYKADNSRHTLSSRISGKGTGSVAMNIERGRIDFGTITKCSLVTRSTWIQNRGCDSLLVEEVQLSSESMFRLDGSPTGTWLQTNEILDLTIEPKKLNPGVHSEYLTVRAKSPNGSRLEYYILLKATIDPAPSGYTLWAPSAIHGITTCSTLDTIVTVRNTSLCDALNLTRTSITGDGLSIVGSAIPITLQPGDSTSIRVRFDGENRTTIDGSLVIETDLFGDINVPLSAPIERAKLCRIFFIDSTTEFSTTQCSTVTKSFSFTTRGCGYLDVSGISLQGAGSCFTMYELSPSPPYEIVEGDTITFKVTYNADQSGADQPWGDKTDLVILSCFGNEHRITLHGSVQNTMTTMSVAMTTDAPSPMTTEDELTAIVHSASDVAAASGLTSFETKLHFDADVFTLEEIEPRVDCTVQQKSIEGGVVLTFTSNSGFELSVGQPIVEIRFGANLTNKTSSSIRLEGLVLNGGDPEYLRCVMTPVPSLHVTSASIELDCGERVVQHVLNGELPFTIETLYPQPASSSEITADLVSQVQGVVSLQIVNMFGQVVHNDVLRIHEGTNMVVLPTTSLSSGAYVLEIVHASRREKRVFVIR